MKLYAIRNWNELFENSRSRAVKDLSWVSVPNHHDGENYSMLMQQEKASEIFAAWILMLQVASKCNPRGSLVKDDGSPHTDRSLSAKCRCPVTWFTLAFEYLEHNTDWLLVKDLDTGYQHPISKPSPSYQVSAEGGRERREWKGGEGTETAPLGLAEIPSWGEFWDYCQSPHCGIAAEWFAKDKFLRASQDNWKGVSDWRKYALRVRGWWDNDGRPMQPRNKKTSNKVVHHLRDSNPVE